MNEQIDPFNRAPLKIEDVIPRPDIKEQIQKFKEEKLKKLKEQREINE